MEIALHDSTSEVRRMAEQFLVDFSDTNIKDWQFIMRNFNAAACPDPSDVENEKQDVIRHYTEFQMISSRVGDGKVSVNFHSFCPFRGRPGDACAAVPGVLGFSEDPGESQRRRRAGFPGRRVLDEGRAVVSVFQRFRGGWDTGAFTFLLRALSATSCPPDRRRADRRVRADAGTSASASGTLARRAVRAGGGRLFATARYGHAGVSVARRRNRLRRRGGTDIFLARHHCISSGRNDCRGTRAGSCCLSRSGTCRAVERRPRAC